MLKTDNIIYNKIVVIGGGSFQGKSLLALKLGHEFNVPLIICTDTIRNILHIQFPDDPNYCTSTYLMHPLNLEKQKEDVSNLLKYMMDIYIKRGENLIIEGMHLSSNFIEYLSHQSNVLIFCIDNELPLRKRLEFKSITRNRMEYYDFKTKQLKYAKFIKKDIASSPYIKHAKRINEIHKGIIQIFKFNNLHIFEFKNINDLWKSVFYNVNAFINK